MSVIRRELRDWSRTLRRRAYASRASEEKLVERFHRLTYDAENWGGTWKDTNWMGVPLQKLPLDLWVYQEILHETRPDLIVETGTLRGGSALFLAHLCDVLGHGEILTIDIEERPGLPVHERVTYIVGSSISREIVARVRQGARGQRVMVVLDSDHTAQHVLAELRAYAPLVANGCYLIVEDTNVGGHPVFPEFGPGPSEAIGRFLKETDEFEIDRRREKFYLTFNPGGYLRRVKEAAAS